MWVAQERGSLSLNWTIICGGRAIHISPVVSHTGETRGWRSGARGREGRARGRARGRGKGKREGGGQGGGQGGGGGKEGEEWFALGRRGSLSLNWTIICGGRAISLSPVVSPTGETTGWRGEGGKERFGESLRLNWIFSGRKARTLEVIFQRAVWGNWLISTSSS